LRPSCPSFSKNHWGGEERRGDERLGREKMGKERKGMRKKCGGEGEEGTRWDEKKSGWLESSTISVVLIVTPPNNH
jgi:hypothetical protein